MKATDKQISYLTKLAKPILDKAAVIVDFSLLSKNEASELIQSLLCPSESIYECNLRSDDCSDLWDKIFIEQV